MNESHPFVTHLENLSEDRGALAVLRRGLGRLPGSVAGMYRYVIPWLPEQAPSWKEEAYFLIAALYAYHAELGGTGNMGNQFARARQKEGDSTAIERRFTALLAADPEDVGFYLRQAVSYLRSKEIPINWHQLLRDVMAWGHPDRYVQKQWARAFWGRVTTETTEGK